MTPITLPSETLAAFGGDELRARIFYEKYALRGPDNQVLETTPPQMWERLAAGLATMETENSRKAYAYKEFRWLLDGFRFVPGGRIMAAIGSDRKVTALNCYVLKSPYDSIEGIFATAAEAARTHAAGGGCGLDISSLRPRGTPVRNSARTSSGAVSFMELYSTETGMIGQCLAKGTQVLTNSGWQPIEQLTTTHRVWTDLGWKPITYIFPSQHRKTLHVRTKLGFEIHASPDHHFTTLTPGGTELRKLAHLRPDDKIIILRAEGTTQTNEKTLAKTAYQRNSYNNSNRLRNILQPTTLTKDLAYFLGYYFGDGSSSQKIRKGKIVGTTLSIAIPLSQPRILPKLAHTLAQTFGLPSTLRPGDGKCVNLSTSSQWLHAFLRHNNLIKPHSPLTYIPTAIKQSPDHILAAFLAGYFDADGYASGSKKGYVFTTTSKMMAHDLHLELLKLGVIANCSRETRPKWRDLYSISITGRSAQIRFVQLLQPHSVKVQWRPFIAKRDTILTPFTSRQLRIPRKSFNYVPGTPQFLSVATLQHYLAETNDPRSSLSLHIQDEILTITPEAPQQTYDIEVADAHKFVAEGFYVSNSGRRGATMLTIADSHPDVLDFCKVKRNRTSVRFANISIRFTDAFMQALERDDRWLLHYENRDRGLLVKHEIPAKELWTELVTGARDWAEPGCLFWSTIERRGTSQYNGMSVVSTNPCGEQSLEPYGACNLGSINLLAFVKQPFAEIAPNHNLDWPALTRAVHAGIRFLDNVLTWNTDHHPLPAQAEAVAKSRRVGLGVTALGDLFVALRLSYGSDASIAFANRLFEHIRNEAYTASWTLAREKGAFPAFDRDTHLHQPFLRELPPSLQQQIAQHGLRNVALMTVPPVGTGAALAGVTSGIEPIFAITYLRRSETLTQEEFTVLHPLVATYWREHLGVPAMRQSNEEIRAALPPYFTTSHDIDPMARVRMQATIGHFVDNAISSTINLPKDTTPDTVDRIYRDAWSAGLKGVTIYRESSRDGILLTPEEATRRSQSTITVHLTKAINRLIGPILPTTAKLTETPTQQDLERLADAIDTLLRQDSGQLQLIPTTPALRPRPKIREGTLITQPAPEGNIEVTIVKVNDEPFEVICHGGKAGSDILAWIQALARTISIFLRLQRLPNQRERLELVIEQLTGISGSRQLGFGPDKVHSGPDGIAKALQRYLTPPTQNATVHSDSPSGPGLLQLDAAPTNGNCCPQCRNFTLVIDEGCLKCPCGFKEC